jgi:hypothetical protein
MDGERVDNGEVSYKCASKGTETIATYNDINFHMKSSSSYKALKICS